MNRTTFRRRPDGVYQIVRRGPVRRLLQRLDALFVGALVGVALALTVTLYLLIGLPWTVAMGVAALCRYAWKRSRQAHAAAREAMARSGAVIARFPASTRRLRDAGA